MIYGIGVDLVDIKRIEEMFKKYGQTFAERILHHVELLEFQSETEPVKYLAKRFAAKEAFSKAVGTGLRGHVSLQNVGVAHGDLGKPEYIYTPALQEWLAEKGITHVHISLSDDGDVATAYAIAEK